MVQYDLVLKGGHVIDGSGNPGYEGDVAINNGKIVRIGSITANAKRIIECNGLVVCPGFIDIHSHSDFSVAVFTMPESKVLQGVTSEVIGNCGHSAFPLEENMLEDVTREVRLLTTDDVLVRWKTYAEYRSAVEKQGLACNIIPLVGHGNLRRCAMGYTGRSASKNEIQRMQKLLSSLLKDGCFGMSSGLIYSPGCFANTEELAELAKVVADFEGVYSTHIRGESHTLLDAVEEAIAVARVSGARLQLSHHKSVGRQNWGKTVISLRLIEQARETGLDVTCDMYPYLAGSGPLSSLLPPWVNKEGNEELVRQLQRPRVRSRIKKEIEKVLPEWWNPIASTGWEGIVLSQAKTPKWSKFIGYSFQEMAFTLQADPLDILFDLLIDEQGEATGIYFQICEEDLRRVLRHPACMVGSDGIALPLDPIKVRGKPHPRSFGTFPRFIGHYVVKEGLLSLEEAIAKVTSRPALKLGLKLRGMIQEGFYGDVVVFSPQGMCDKSTFELPFQGPDGIQYVLVNGVIKVEGGRVTGYSAGRFLARGEE